MRTRFQQGLQAGREVIAQRIVGIAMKTRVAPASVDLASHVRGARAQTAKCSQMPITDTLRFQLGRQGRGIERRGAAERGGLRMSRRQPRPASCSKATNAS